MTGLMLCKEDGLWAMLPDRSGGDAYGLQRLDAANANSAEALAALAAVGSGSACIIELQRYEEAVAHLPHVELVQAITGAMLLGSSGRPLCGLLPTLQQCGEAVADVPALSAAVLAVRSNAVGGSWGAGSVGGGGSSNSSAASPGVFELMHLLSKHSVQGTISRLDIQFDHAQEERQLRRQMQLLPTPLQQPLAPYAAALAKGGTELWVRWADSADDWCLFKQAPGERPCALCSCGHAGFGLLFCEHLASAYCACVAAPSAASGCASSSRRGGAGEGSSAATAPVALNVEALEAACAELTAQQLHALLLCTALYTGAGSVLLGGLGLELADLQPLGGAGLAPEAAAILAAGKPAFQHVLQASGVQIGMPSVKPSRQSPPGCILGSWRPAVPAAAGPVRCATISLLQHAALQLPPPSAEGLWLSLGMATGLTGLQLDAPRQHQPAKRGLAGRQLLQAAQLLLSAGHRECGRHLVQELVVALSLPPVWPADIAEWRSDLVKLWRQLVPAAAGVAWWMTQLPAHSSGTCPSRLSQQLQRLSAVCSVDYIKLIDELLGPVAAAQLTSAVLQGLNRAFSRGAARCATGQTKSACSIADLITPARTAAAWLSSSEAAGVGPTANREQLLQPLQTYLNRKALQRTADGQGCRPASRGDGRRKVRRRVQQGDTAGGQQGQGGAAEAPSLLAIAAKGVAERLLALPLDQAMRLFDGLVPDLEPVVLAELAALQAQQLRSLQSDLNALLQIVQHVQHAQQRAEEAAAAGDVAGASAAAAAAAAGAQQAQQGQQGRPRLQDLHPNQRTSVIDQIINTLPPADRAAYRHIPRDSLVVEMQPLYENFQGRLRIPPPAGAGPGSAAGQQRPQQQGLLQLLAAAAAPQPASSKRRLAYAACHSLEQLCRRHGWEALQQLEAEGGAGWRHLISLLEQAQPQCSPCSCDVLPAVLGAVCYVFTEAKRTRSVRQRRQVADNRQQQQQPQAAAVPADVVGQLVSMLPDLLDACCEAAWEALHGHGGSGRGGGGNCGIGGSHAGQPVAGNGAAAATFDSAGGGPGARPGSHAAPPYTSNRSVVADRDALALALSGLHSCLKLTEDLYYADGPVCPSKDHTVTASQLRSLMAGALVRAASVLLEAAVAADQAAAEVYIRLYMTVQHDWTVEAERAASALLPLLPWTVPAAAEGSCPATSAAAAARDPAPSILSLRRQILATAAALQQVRFASPVRRNSLALACRCLQAAAVSQALPAAERQQAAEALLRVLLSPAAAGELEPTDLRQHNTQELMECALGAVAVVLQSGCSDAGLGGELAYLAVNLLAYAANLQGVPLMKSIPGTHNEHIDNISNQHACWQRVALQVFAWWQGHATGCITQCEPLAGGPPPLFCASTLMALLLRACDPTVQAEAVAMLARLAAADPQLLLRCDSLPQLVHLAFKRVFDLLGTRQLQESIDAMLSALRAAAIAAGRAEQHMWPVWQQHSPASVPARDTVCEASGRPGSLAAEYALLTRPWDRLEGRRRVLQAVGREGDGAAGSTATRARGAAAGDTAPGMNPSVAALREAAIRSAAAELMMGAYGPPDIYGEFYSDEEEDYDDEADDYDLYGDEDMLLEGYW